MNVIFNNHASITIKTDDLNILTDPWFKGSAFNDGWNLIYENEESEEYFLKNINYIWISHEHPDHFQPKFFINNKSYIKENNIKILFQKTKDQRVINFFKKLNIDFLEIDENKEIKLSEKTKCVLFKAEFYDSSILIKSNNKTLLNLNDCQYSDRELKKIKKKCGKVDLLLTQFSYAAWKGGKENVKWRQVAAERKLNSLENQCKILESKCIIPIASFIYYSHQDNFYMNDCINDIDKVSLYLDHKKINYKVLKPNEIFKIDTTNIINDNSKAFWKKKYQDLNNKKLNEYNKSYTLEELNKAYQEYKNNIFKKNNKFIMKIVSIINFLKIFQPIIIHISDLDINIKFDFFNKNLDLQNNNLDHKISLHSNSLFFIFKNEFGFDTLSVNALFESDFNGFKKLVFNFAIGSYNAAGMFIRLKSAFNLKVFFLVLQKIRTIKLQF